MLEAGSIMERQSDLIGTRSNPPDFLRLLISSDEGSQPHCININFLHSRYVLILSRPSGMKLIPKYTQFLYMSFCTLSMLTYMFNRPLHCCGIRGRRQGPLGCVFIEVVVVYVVLFGKFYRWTILQCRIYSVFILGGLFYSVFIAT